MPQGQLTRRSVLKAAAGTVAGPYMVTSTALGNAATRPAGERVALGHIGVGNRGKALLQGFLECTGCQCVAVADAYKDRREEAARMIAGRAYADFRELIAREDIDAVIIATPDHWHVPMAMAAARAGKDAYVEKPLGLSIEQDLACRRLFRQKRRVFQYGTQQRSMAHCRFGCELVRSGRIGKVHTIEVVAPDGHAGGSTQQVPVPDNLEYDRWLGPAPVKPYTQDRCVPPGTYFIYDYSIGYLAGWGAHPLDIMVWGSDADLAGPMVVDADGVIPEKGLYDAVIHWDARIQLGDAVGVTFEPGHDSTKFIGTDGWVRIWRGGIDAEPKSLLDLGVGPAEVRLTESPRHDQNFVDAVRSRKTPVSTLADAVRSDIISHLCDISVRTGRKITWDPEREVIVGDAEASRLLSRPMREPWTL